MPHQSSDQNFERMFSFLAPFLKNWISCIKEDPTLQPEFRCPTDGSSRTYKISAVLASRPKGTVSSNGKVFGFSGGSQAMDDLDPGNEPREQKGMFYFGGAVLILGAFLSFFGTGCSVGGGIMMVIVGIAPMALAYSMDRDVEARHAEWVKKSDRAKTHWWCEACHTKFLPEVKPEGGSDCTIAESGPGEPEVDGANNVETLRSSN